MRVFTNLCINLLIFSLLSCRETSENNKEILEVSPMIEQVDSTSNADELGKMSEKLDDQLKELDKAIENLNNN